MRHDFQRLMTRRYCDAIEASRSWRALSRCSPRSARVQWVGEAGTGSRLKLAANHWMIAMVTALAETMHLCDLMTLDRHQFVTLLDGGPLSSYGLEKLGEMQHHEYPAGLPVRLALKDPRLVREVAEDSGVELPMLNAVLERIGDVENRHADDDLAAVYEQKLSRGRGKPSCQSAPGVEIRTRSTTQSFVSSSTSWLLQPSLWPR